MPRSYWLIKSEPFKYAWDELVEQGSTYWDGVRNYEARNNLRSMAKGDLALYYHSNEGKEVVGVARVCAEHYPDPTADDDTWVVVDVEPLRPLAAPVPLARFREDPVLAGSALVKRSRLSVVPFTRDEFERVLALGRTSLSGPPPKDMRSAKPAAGAASSEQTARKRSARTTSSKKKASGKKTAGKRTARKKTARKKKAAAKKPAARKSAMRRASAAPDRRK